MNARDWALITFTILTQMSVGSFLVLGIVHYYANRKAGMKEADRLSDYALLAIVVVFGLALVASLLHLGNPLNAPRAVTHLATSWLSREILSGVIFAVLAVVFALMQWRKIASFAVRNVIAWVTCCRQNHPGIVWPHQLRSLPPHCYWGLWQWALRLWPIMPIYREKILKKPKYNPNSCEVPCEALQWLRWYCSALSL